MRISVIGLGQLGLVHAAALASLGHAVVGVERDASRVAKALNGALPLQEPGLRQLVQQGLASGRLLLTTDMAAVREAEVHFLAVGTPSQSEGAGFDTSYLEHAVQELAEYLLPGDVVVGKSTVPPGTASTLARMLASQVDDVELAWNPEFLAEGTAVRDTLNPARLIYGVAHGQTRAAAVLDEIYAALLQDGVPRVVTSLATAELVKLATNAFLATKISFVNAVAGLAPKSGADAHEVAELLAEDPRIGSSHMRPGLGYGGGCLPKDTRGLAHYAATHGAGETVTFFSAVNNVNLLQRTRLAAQVLRACDGVAAPVVAILGASFKPGTADVRDSPSLDLARMLEQVGVTVRIADPGVTRIEHERLRRAYTQNIRDTVCDADVVVLATAWPEFGRLCPEQLGALVRKRIMIDARGMLPASVWCDAGWQVESMFPSPELAGEGKSKGSSL